MTYSEKLRDPRWQKKRLKILDASDFTCEDCGARDKTLEVHHCFYLRGLEPWEYGPEFLMSLCGDCHQRRQALEQSAFVALAIRIRKMPICELERFVWDPLERKAKLDHAITSGDITP